MQMTDEQKMDLTEKEKQMHRDALISGEGKMLVEEPKEEKQVITISIEEFELASTKSIKLRKMIKQFDDVQEKIDKIPKATKTAKIDPVMAKQNLALYKRADDLEKKMKKEAYVVLKNLKSINQ